MVTSETANSSEPLPPFQWHLRSGRSGFEFRPTAAERLLCSKVQTRRAARMPLSTISEFTIDFAQLVWSLCRPSNEPDAQHRALHRCMSELGSTSR
jgi:hypothetical protein